jgi:hypothetical protein
MPVSFHVFVIEKSLHSIVTIFFIGVGEKGHLYSKAKQLPL